MEGELGSFEEGGEKDEAVGSTSGETTGSTCLASLARRNDEAFRGAGRVNYNCDIDEGSQ